MVLLVFMIVAPYCATAQVSVPALPDSSTTKTHDQTLPPTNTPLADSAQHINPHTLESPIDTATLAPIPSPLTRADKKRLKEQSKPKVFNPDPQRALWLSLVIPGGGQIYNRKYWKLPIFYGGFIGCMYAFTWNQQMYLDYSQAYLDIMDDNPDTNSYITMFPSSYDIENNKSRFQTIFKNRKDMYRRWRDLSTFCFIGVYALSIIDAYVDAHLSVFDISPDLSLRWGPTSVEGPHPNIGVGAALCF